MGWIINACNKDTCGGNQLANQQQLDLLKQNVHTWNQWRQEHPDIRPDLSGSDLAWACLSNADLSGVDLSGVDLTWADLYRANLVKADLSKANLSGADLSGTHLCRA